MKSIIALGVGLVVALAPGGTAFAAPAEPHGTGKGKAYGNCQHSSAGGDHDPLPSTRTGNGNGGHVVRGDRPTLPCKVVEAPPAAPEVVEEIVVVETDGDAYVAPADGEIN